jgi:hypothetical protein
MSEITDVTLDTFKEDTETTSKVKPVDTTERMFADVKTDYGMVVVQGNIFYGCHLKGTLTEKSKTAFSVLSTSIDDVEDLKVDTFLFGSIGKDGKLKIAEIEPNKSMYDWFFTNSITITLPTLSIEVKQLVLKDINKWKGMYEGSNNTLSRLSSLPGDLFEIVAKSTQYTEVLNQLETLGTQLQLELSKIKQELKGVGLEGFIDRYAFKEHVLVAGPSGASKTYTVDKFVTENGYTKEFIAGHEAIESTDLLGYPIRHVDGSFIWMDGPLTAAFRNAQVEKTVLFIDELLRIPSKELNILVGALTPNSNKEFVLRTNRLIDVERGIGKSETLIVPVENLWVVGTTNMGGNYDVNEMDLALNDRFMITDVTIEQETIDTIIAASDVNNLGEIVQEKLSKLFQLVNSLVAAQELTFNMNIRHITKVLKNTTDSKEIKSYLRDLAPQICSRTTEGGLNQSELQIYRDTIDSLF